MIFRLDAAFRDERERYRLRMCCEDCVLFDPRGQGRCVHGFPSERHRRAALEPSPAATGEDAPIVYFCKEFSLL